MEVFFGPFHFSSNFECGNLDRVVQIEPPGSNHNKVLASTPTSNSSRKVPKISPCSPNAQNFHIDYEFNLWTKHDCSGTEFENNNRTWFCFCIRGGEPGKRVNLSVMNLNRQYKLYSQGMLPVVQCVGDCLQNSKWERIKERCTYRSEDGNTVISWIHSVPTENRATYYAFTYPFSYSDLQTYLEKLDSLFANNLSDIYYIRELLTKSLDGSRLDIITISSHLGMKEEREDRLPNLFPDCSISRPNRFEGKKFVFVSARVHPGETPSSYVMNGFINFIISNDPLARRIRDSFVFKIIPMLNPDGVIRGHYRTDQRGVNLNRVYVNPSYKFHPTIYAVKKVIMYHHYGMNLNTFLKSEEVEQSHEASTEQLYSNPSILDEDTCHSFSDAVKYKNESSISNKTPQTILEVDEPSASGWDCSSNISIDSSGRVGSFHPGDFGEMHDDCSNLSYVGDGETGVTNMFGSLSPLHELKLTLKNELKDQGSPSESFSLLRHDHPLISCPLASDKQSIDSKLTPNAFSSKLNFIRDLSNSSDIKDSAIDKDKKSLDKNSESNLFMYIDLHGHASKRGIFMYGNWFQDTELMVENMLFPKILSLNCQNFDYGACNFSERNMYHKDRRDGMSKEGSGRVAVMRATGLLRSYTLECNYNTGRIVNPVSSGRTVNLSSATSPLYKTSSFVTPPKYSPTIFEDCGHKLGVSLFDLIEHEDFSKSSSHYINVNTVRSQIRSTILGSTNSPRLQHPAPSPGDTTISKISLPRFRSLKPNLDSKVLDPENDYATTSKVQTMSQISKHSPPHKSPSKLPHLHSTRKSAWTMSVDAENQEPSSQVCKSPKNNPLKAKKIDGSSNINPHIKVKTAKLKSSSPKKLLTSQSLFYSGKDSGEASCNQGQEQAISKLTSSKHGLTSSVCITPNISFKVSITDTPDTPKLIKKMERGRKQRNKALNIVSKKLKTNVSMLEASSVGDETLSYLDKCSNQSSLSPRSPLASVCEPQSSQCMLSPGNMTAQPKSPPFAKASKTSYSSAKRPTKHTIKHLSKSVDRLPVVTSTTGQRLKLLPKKVKKKVFAPGSSQTHLQWVMREPLKVSEEVDAPILKVKKRKKSLARKSL